MGEDSRIERFLEEAGNLPDSLRRLIEEAYQAAPRYGSLIGRVSRFYPVTVGGSQRVVVEVDPETYYGDSRLPVHRIGDYLAIVDLKGRLVLGRVSSIERSDLLSILGGQRPPDTMPSIIDPNSLATTTLVAVEPVMESDIELSKPPVPASTSIEPQSPVVDPSPETTRRLLNLPGSGALLGALATPSGLVKEGAIPVYLPFKVFLQHVLIIGTTGSGKTTLLKNMASHVYSRVDGDTPAMVFIDLNQDFIQILFDPLPHPQDPDSAAVRARLYEGVGPVRGVIVVVPMVDYVVEELVEHLDLEGGDSWCMIARAAAERHFNESIRPIVEALDPAMIDSLRVNTVGSRRGLCRVEYVLGGRTIVYIPYAVNTMKSTSATISKLMPGLTLLSLQLFKRTREKYRRIHGFYPPLIAMAAAVDSYLSAIASKTTPRDRPHGILAGEIAEFLSNRLRVLEAGRHGPEYYIGVPVAGLGKSLVDITVEYLEILEEARPHRGTLEALYRRLSSLLDSGVLDIIYPEAGGDKLVPRVAGEPEWGDILELAIDLNYPIILDLGILNVWSYESGEASRLIAYRMLERLKEWKHMLWARRSGSPLARRKVIVVIDEAHQFFPQEKGTGEEQEASRQVAAMISSIARLGRARGIGLVFATHSPKDLHDIIVQLANTKIVLRTEKNQLEHIDLPGDVKGYVPRLPDRYMVVASYIYRDYVVAATTTPLTMHYDLSA
ncbi:MAG: DUF87 domain-containing protein [Desulfurococcales archaeon]|nr:DUF87 domain-containing protein [Desulfurococcales archaeon]